MSTAWCYIGAAQLDPTPCKYVEYNQIGWTKGKHLLSTHATELIHCNVNLMSSLNLTSGGGVSLSGPNEMYTRSPPKKTRVSRERPTLELPLDMGIHYRGCSGRWVQWMGVATYYKTAYNIMWRTTPCFHCTPRWWILRTAPRAMPRFDCRAWGHAITTYRISPPPLSQASFGSGVIRSGPPPLRSRLVETALDCPHTCFARLWYIRVATSGLPH